MNLGRIAAVLKSAFGFVEAVRNPVTGRIKKTAGGAVIGYDSKLKRLRDFVSANYGTALATFGDSIMDQALSFSSKRVSNLSPTGFIGHMQSISMGMVRVGGVYGYPGQNTAYIHARLVELISTIDETVILYFPGANDIKSAISPAALYEQIVSGVAVIELAGKIPVLCTIFPASQSLEAYDDSLRLATNNLLRGGASRGEFALIDWAGLYEQADGSIDNTHVTFDWVHPNVNTAERGAILALNVVCPTYTLGINYLSQLTHDSVFFPLTKQFGTGGQASSPATGVVWDGCYIGCYGNSGVSAAGSIVPASIDDPDPAQWQQITVNGASGAPAEAELMLFSNNVYPGVRQFFLEVEFSAASDDAITSVGARLLSKGDSQGVQCMWSAPATYQYSGAARRRLLISPPFELTGDQASDCSLHIHICVAASKSATLKIRRIGDMPAEWVYPGSESLPTT